MISTQTEFRNPITSMDINRIDYHHWATLVFRGWAKKALISPSPLCCHLASRDTRSSLHLLSGLLAVFSCRTWFSSGDTRGPSVVFEAVNVPCAGPLRLYHIADYDYDF